jgi:hypothetical protein
MLRVCWLWWVGVVQVRFRRVMLLLEGRSDWDRFDEAIGDNGDAPWVSDGILRVGWLRGQTWSKQLRLDCYLQSVQYQSTS